MSLANSPTPSNEPAIERAGDEHLGVLWDGTLAAVATLKRVLPVWTGKRNCQVEPELPGWPGGTHFCWQPADRAYLHRCPLCEREVEGYEHYQDVHGALVDADGMVLPTGRANPNHALFQAKSRREYSRKRAAESSARERTERALGGTLTWPRLLEFESEICGRSDYPQEPSRHARTLARGVRLPGRRSDPLWLYDLVVKTGLSRRQVSTWAQNFRYKTGKVYWHPRGRSSQETCRGDN